MSRRARTGRLAAVISTSRFSCAGLQRLPSLAKGSLHVRAEFMNMETRSSGGFFYRSWKLSG